MTKIYLSRTDKRTDRLTNRQTDGNRHTNLSQSFLLSPFSPLSLSLALVVPVLLITCILCIREVSRRRGEALGQLAARAAAPAAGAGRQRRGVTHHVRHLGRTAALALTATRDSC